MRQLSEEIERGIQAIALAQEGGVDTAKWEERLAVLQSERLLEWATMLSNRDTNLDEPIQYVEAPLRTVTTKRASFYARTYLRSIVMARLCQATRRWKPPTPDYWERQEAEAVGALKSLREALEQHEGSGE